MAGSLLATVAAAAAVGGTICGAGAAVVAGTVVGCGRRFSADGGGVGFT